MEKKPLILLVGPTAVGKTSISINIAKKINSEIISADSMQIYKYMDVGTAKIRDDEKKGIKHYMIDIVKPDEQFSVSDFQKKSYEYIDHILSNDSLPMVVGGTGLYINSLVNNLDFTNAVSNWQLREKYKEKAKKYGNEYIHSELRKVDAESADRIHVNDTKRIIRALEVYYETGKPMTYYYNKFRQPNPRFNIAYIGLKMSRKRLYDRINKRVDIMINNGLIDEVKEIIEMGYSRDLTSLKAIGYKEIIKYIDGEYSLNEAKKILKRNTRRFAKRQLTWFRRDKRVYWVNIDEFESEEVIINNIIKYISKKLKQNF